MIESKTLNTKDEIPYYRIFGWRKVGEYHGPSLMGTENLVSADGKTMLRDKLVDEYYLQRDKADRRYVKWVENEKAYRKYYDLTKKTEVEAKAVKNKKSRKALKASFIVVLLIAIAVFVAAAVVTFLPQLFGMSDIELFSEEWKQLAIITGSVAGGAFVVIIASSIIIHKNRSRPLEKMLEYYKMRYLEAYRDSATMSGLQFSEDNMIEPLRFSTTSSQPTAN